MEDKPLITHLADGPTTFTDFQVSLDVADVLQGQGVPPSRASAALTAAARDVLDEVHALIAPAALVTILPVLSFEHEMAVLSGGATLRGPLAARALAGASHAALAMCTIGPALEERMAHLFTTGEAVRAMGLDGAGIAAIRKVAEMTGVRICDAATARGLKIGMRASPGQEGWAIQQQRVLFDLLPAERIGIQLTSSCLMIPHKSVSFVAGLGPDMRADAVPCDFCSKQERCQWQRRSNTGAV